MRATVYLVTNAVNGKTYVGVTRFSVAKRWGEHVAQQGEGPYVSICYCLTQRRDSN